MVDHVFDTLFLFLVNVLDLTENHLLSNVKLTQIKMKFKLIQVNKIEANKYTIIIDHI